MVVMRALRLVRVVGPDLAARLNAAAIRQSHVHDHHIGLMRTRGRNRSSRGGGVRDQRKVAQLTEQIGQRKTNQPVLVDHEDADESVAHT